MDRHTGCNWLIHKPINNYCWIVVIIEIIYIYICIGTYIEMLALCYIFILEKCPHGSLNKIYHWLISNNIAGDGNGKIRNTMLLPDFCTVIVMKVLLKYSDLCFILHKIYVHNCNPYLPKLYYVCIYVHGLLNFDTYSIDDLHMMSQLMQNYPI